MYNLTALATATDAGDLVSFANNSTEGILLGFLLIGIYFVMLFALKRYDFDSALLASSWTMFLLSAILAYGKYVNIIFPLGFLCIAAFSALYVWLTRRD